MTWITHLFTQQLLSALNMTDTFLGTGDRVMNKLGKYIILNIYIIVKGYNMKLNSTTKSKEQKECIKIKIVWEAATEK